MCTTKGGEKWLVKDLGFTMIARGDRMTRIRLPRIMKVYVHRRKSEVWFENTVDLNNVARKLKELNGGEAYDRHAYNRQNQIGSLTHAIQAWLKDVV
jgi:hypothetical protein